MHDILRLPPGPEDAPESPSLEVSALRHENDRLIGLLELLQRVAVSVNRAESVEEALREALALLVEFNGWALGHVFLRSEESGRLVPTDIWYAADGVDFTDFRAATLTGRFAEGEGVLGAVAVSGRAAWIDDMTRAPEWSRTRDGLDHGFHAAVLFPILAADRVLGVIEFYSRRVIEPEERFQRMMRNVGLQLGHVIERRRLERSITEITDEEQRRIGEELHDSLGQQITAVALSARGIQRGLERRKAPEADDLKRLIENLEQAKSQVGAVIKGLIPLEVQSLSLPEALGSLAERSGRFYGIVCRFVDHSGSLLEESPRAMQLYRITQEAVHNAVKHGRARQVQITLSADPSSSRASLRIIDDGAGFKPGEQQALSTGMGLQIMRHRASLLGGTLEVSPRASAGFLVSCDFPFGTVVEGSL